MKYYVRNKYNGKILTQAMSSYFQAKKIEERLNAGVPDTFEVVTSKTLEDELSEKKEKVPNEK